MHNLLVYLGGVILGCGLLVTGQQQGTCDDFTVDNCMVSSEDIIQEIPGFPEDTSQKTCDAYTNCVLFRYQQSNQVCQLINKDFRQNCQQVGGGREGNLEDCLNSDLNGCNAFIEESCTFIGDQLVFSPPDGEISNPYECEALCQVFETLGCNYWIYDISALSCRLMTSGSRTCDTMSGPQAPPIDTCGFSTAGPATTASP